MAKILVGIPTWKRPLFVRTALQSVLRQSFTDIRVIVSDNCSPPEVADDIREYIDSLHDPRVEFVEQPCNRGEKGQMEYLLEKCEEEFIVFLHDDDKMEPTLLDNALSVLQKHDTVDFYSTDQYAFDEQGRYLADVSQEYHASLHRDRLPDGIVANVLEKMLTRGIFSISGTVFRTQSLRECGLQDSDTTFPCDFNVFLRQAENNRTAWWDSRQLAGYRFHEGQERNNCQHWEYNEKHIKGYLEMLEPRRFTGNAEALRKSLLSFAYRRCAYIQFSRFRLISGYRWLCKAVAEDPWNWRLWGYVSLAVFFPIAIPPIWGKRVSTIG